MSKSPEFMEHWVEIEPERMQRYETMFQWTPAAERFYEPADIRPGHSVVDYGCAVGDASIEFAHRVGAAGHVHGIDINPDFISKATQKAMRAGVGEQTSFHLLKDAHLPLPEASVDRVVVRNTLIYVEDPLYTVTEFRRVLNVSGIFHAIESDWSLTVVEPVGTDLWRQVIEAARWAWPRPQIGRQLYGFARDAGFDEVSVQVITVPDMSGRLLGMIRTVAGYASESNEISPQTIDTMLETVEGALAAGTFLALAPQFLVTARK